MKARRGDHELGGRRGHPGTWPRLQRLSPEPGRRHHLRIGWRRRRAAALARRSSSYALAAERGPAGPAGLPTRSLRTSPRASPRPRRRPAAVVRAPTTRAALPRRLLHRRAPPSRRGGRRPAGRRRPRATGGPTPPRPSAHSDGRGGARVRADGERQTATALLAARGVDEAAVGGLTALAGPCCSEPLSNSGASLPGAKNWLTKPGRRRGEDDRPGGGARSPPRARCTPRRARGGGRPRARRARRRRRRPLRRARRRAASSRGCRDRAGAECGALVCAKATTRAPPICSSGRARAREARTTGRARRRRRPAARDGALAAWRRAMRGIEWDEHVVGWAAEVGRPRRILPYARLRRKAPQPVRFWVTAGGFEL